MSGNDNYAKVHLYALVTDRQTTLADTMKTTMSLLPASENTIAIATMAYFANFSLVSFSAYSFIHKKSAKERMWAQKDAKRQKTNKNNL